MKKLPVFIIIVLLVVSCKQNTKSEIGTIWQIDNNNGVISYIFGTIHLYPSSEMELSSEIISKLQDCNVLALERDLTDSIENKKYSDYFDQAQNLGFLKEGFKLVIEEYGDELKFMEGELIRLSRKSNTKVIGLDSFEEIVETFDKVSSIGLEDEIATLTDYQKGIPLYLRGSIHEIKEITTKIIGTQASELMIDIRNENWIDDIEALIAKDKTFIAVGFTHLGGEKGVLNLLTNKGYSVRKVN